MKNDKEMKKLYIGGALLILFLLLVLWGLIKTPYDPKTMDAAMKLAKVSRQHIMGCDQFGRDIFSRVLIGIRTTFLIALGTNLIGAFFGILIGALTGYFGGIFDGILMRFNDVVLSFPSILLALVFIALMGCGTNELMISMGIVFVPSYARIVRAEFIKCRNRDYVQAVRLMGAKPLRIMFVHILPNIKGTLLTSLIIGFNNAVLCEAAMSFLGIGVQPPEASLGLMLSDAQAYLFSAPFYSLIVGTVMVLLILSFSLLSDALSEVNHA
ncbi:MAG: ABC transporter permease [Lachnospiraceae bacterium]|nr:ABC transporter permease [Lachnospiraceae bacterium]